MASTAGMRMRQPLCGIFPPDGSRTFPHVRSWLAQPCLPMRLLPSTRTCDQQGVGEVMIAIGLLGWFFPRWCGAPGINAACGRNDAHSALLLGSIWCCFAT